MEITVASLNEQRKTLNRAQRELRRALEGGQDHPAALALFRRQHAQLHSATMANLGLWSYEDALLDDINEEQFRTIPPRGEHSVAWTFYHMARIEDITMNLLVARREQILYADNWPEKMDSPCQHSGNSMTQAEVQELSAQLDLAALRAYRRAVGQRTQHVVAALKPEDMQRKPNPEDLALIWEQGAVLPAASGIVDYWSRRTLTGLLLMPPTRHLIVHLNEAAQIKRRLA